MNAKEVNRNAKIILPGGAGLVGQNLVVWMKGQGYHNVVVLDKHEDNVATMRRLHPDIVVECVDLAESGQWEHHFQGASAVVMLQAQIGAKESELFDRNNLLSTELIIGAILDYSVPYTIHISSSVVESVADDNYTRTKREQERMFLESGLQGIVLRPTLMFGWFDRKHLGWLARFMKRTPLFPIPGHGRYMRQPLYVGDFCQIILTCLKEQRNGSCYNISGVERIDYVDMIRHIRTVVRARCWIIHLPYWLFDVLLRFYALFSRNPPFTSDQLKALTAGDEFEVIDWPVIFGVQPTPFEAALWETFDDPRFSHIELKF